MTDTGPEATLPDTVVQGIAAIRAGRPGEALDHLLPLISADGGGPPPEAALVYAGVAALLEGRGDLFFDQLVPIWEARSGDPFAYVHDVGHQLFWIGKQEVLERALEACPEAGMLRFPLLYFAACMAFRADEAAAGFALAHRFRRAAFTDLNAMPFADDNFHVMFRQMVLIEDHRYLADPAFDDNYRAIAPKLTPLSLNAAGNEPVLLACCDPEYLALFAEGFVHSAGTQIDAPIRIHLHVIDPDSATEENLRSLAGCQSRLPLTWSVEDSGDLGSAVYYACARFVRLPEFLTAWNRPLLVSDIDCRFVADPTQLLAGLANVDAVFLEKPDHVGPCSRYPAALVAFAPSAGGRALAKFLHRYILSKFPIMRQLLWLVDQGALFTAHHIAAQLNPKPRIVSLTQTQGLTLGDFAQTQESTVPKIELMKKASAVDK